MTVEKKIDPRSRAALTDQVAYAGRYGVGVKHAAKLVTPRVPYTWVSGSLKSEIQSQPVPALLCDHKSGAIGPASRYVAISLIPGTQVDVTCKKCRKILGLD